MSHVERDVNVRGVVMERPWVTYIQKAAASRESMLTVDGVLRCKAKQKKKKRGGVAKIVEDARMIKGSQFFRWQSCT